MPRDRISSVKLSLVTETYPPEINGAAMTLHHLASGLVSSGHTVEVIRPRQKGEVRRAQSRFVDELGVAPCRIPGIPIPFYTSLRMGLPIFGSLRRHWRPAAPDIVHVATEGPLGLAAERAAGGLGLPTTSSFHTNFHQYSGHYGLRVAQNAALGYLRWFHNRTRCTMVPTREMQAQLEKSGFLRLSVLSRGVDAALFSPEKRSEALRTRWGVASRDPVAIYVGRLAAEKNLALAVRAFLALHSVNPRAKFVLVGDGPERAALQKAYPHFEYAGVRRGEDLAAHYASADLFVFPSVTETFGNVITEAIASGLVVLSYHYAASKQHIVPGVSGFTAPFGDKEAFVAQAQSVMTAEERWPEIRRRAREAALTISWDAIVDQFEETLLNTAFPRVEAAEDPLLVGRR